VVALIGSTMSARQQLAHEERERRINAASEFTRSVHATIDAIRDAVKEDSPDTCSTRQRPRDHHDRRADQDEEKKEKEEKEKEEALRLLHTAETQNSVVQCLFAGEQTTTGSATEIRDQLREANDLLTKPPGTDSESSRDMTRPEWRDAVRSKTGEVEGTLDAFVEAAAAVVTKKKRQAGRLAIWRS
jgi:hypothetical protein